MSALVAVTQVSGVAWGQTARPACFIGLGNTNPVVGTTLTSADASTSQVLEVLAERRRDEATPCPLGLSRVDGMCVAQQIASVATVPPPTIVPKPVVIAATPVPPAPVAPVTPPPKAAVGAPFAQTTKAAVATGAPSSKTALAKAITPTPILKMVNAPRPTIATKNEDAVQQPIPEDSAAASGPLRRNGAWSEAFAQREYRPSGKADTMGIVGGYDRQFTWDNASVRMGSIGSYSETRQSSQAIKFTDRQGRNPPSDGRIPPSRIFTFENSEETNSRPRSVGAGGGLTWSVAKGSTFLDGVAKVDVFELGSNIARESGVDITAGRPLNEKIYFQDGSSRDWTPETRMECFSMHPNAFLGSAEDIKRNIANEIRRILTPVTTSQVVMSLSNNIGIIRDLGNGYSLEASAGFRYLYSHFYNTVASLDQRDGQTLRLEAGGKISHRQPVGRQSIWTNTVGFYLYSDVWVDGYVTTTDGSTFKGDEGLIRARGMLQSRIQFADGLQLYGEVNGRVGEDYRAIGGKLGARLEW
jgi:hypothetical protein